MRYGDNCKLSDLVNEVSHAAFKVDDLEEAIKGKEVIIKANSNGKGVIVAFIVENGTPVELLKYSNE